ncbi:MAG: flagellar motor switch protein FliN [Bacillota bacterium]|jgi:flagellar motor switch protein FliN/FliY
MNLSQEEIDALLKGDPVNDEPLKEDAPVPAAPAKRKAALSAAPKEMEAPKKGQKEPDAKKPEVQPVVFAEFSKDDTVEVPVAGMDVLLDVPLQISVELGRARCFVKDLLNLTVGSVVELDKAAGESVDVLVNGKVFAHGEVVVVDENFGVRVHDIVSKSAIDKGARKITQ